MKTSTPEPLDPKTRNLLIQALQHHPLLLELWAGGTDTFDENATRINTDLGTKPKQKGRTP